jgi:O-antigen/teichoic acid export membrane protein
MVIGSIQTFYQSAAVGIQSAAGAVWAGNDSQKIQKMFTKAELGLHTVTVFLFSCVGLLIVPFVRVYTNGLTDASYIQPFFAMLMVIAYGIRCLRTPYNIWILAAGHFKQTQRCHIIAAVLNLVLSALSVSRYGLIGIAVGTLVAMCYQTAWMTVYTVRNLVKCSASHVIKRYLVDVVTVVIVCAAASWIKLGDVSYIGWLIMAIKVTAIVAVCVTVTTIVFYREEVSRFLK